MIDRVSGNVRYAVMSFGGFIGRGEPSIMTPRGGYVTNVTEAQLKDAPEFSDDSRNDRDWETAGTSISKPGDDKTWAYRINVDQCRLYSASFTNFVTSAL